MSHNYVELDRPMEAPCLCDCGIWFDLDEGRRSKKDGDDRIICEVCYREQKEIILQIEKLEEEVFELEFYDKKPKRVMKLKEKINKLKEEI